MRRESADAVRVNFATPGLARRFTRNARGRGYSAAATGRLVVIDGRLDLQLAELVRAYAGVLDLARDGR